MEKALSMALRWFERLCVIKSYVDVEVYSGDCLDFWIFMEGGRLQMKAGLPPFLQVFSPSTNKLNNCTPINLVVPRR